MKPTIAEQILNPTAYKRKEGIKTPNPESADPYHWCTETVIGILERQEYTGCTVNFKTCTNSIWDKKQRENPAENRAVFYNTHPAIIEPEVFDKVQEIRQQRHRRTKSGNTHMFSGIVFCADCKGKMYFSGAHDDPNKWNYTCSNSRSSNSPCTAHFIRAIVLERLVWNYTQRVIDLVLRYEAHFRAVMEEKMQTESKAILKAKRKQLEKAAEVLRKEIEVQEQQN